MSERENTLDEIISRLNIAEKISELKDMHRNHPTRNTETGKKWTECQLAMGQIHVAWHDKNHNENHTEAQHSTS